MLAFWLDALAAEAGLAATAWAGAFLTAVFAAAVLLGAGLATAVFAADTALLAEVFASVAALMVVFFTQCFGSQRSQPVWRPLRGRRLYGRWTSWWGWRTQLRAPRMPS